MYFFKPKIYKEMGNFTLRIFLISILWLICSVQNIRTQHDTHYQQVAKNFAYQDLNVDDSGPQERSVDVIPAYGPVSFGNRVVEFQKRRPPASCSANLWQGEGNFTSYNYPGQYPTDLECIYRIPRVDFSTCALEVTFHDFDVETDGVDCSRDYLTIGKKRFCGRLRSGLKEIVEFPYNENELIFKFTSDSASTGRGFLIEVQRKYSSCYSAEVQLSPALNVKYVRGRLTSYGYPDYYRENMNCTYFIERQPGFCNVELEFIDFDVDEDSPRCSRDYLLLEGVRYCGTTLYGRKLTLDFRGRSEIAISFVADDHSGNRGFDIRYNQLPCYREPEGRTAYIIDAKPVAKPSCDSTHSSREIFLESYDYPNIYDSNLDCTHTIQRSSADVCELEFTFLNFDVEYDRLCRGDYLDINGGKICGPLPSKTTRRVRFYGPEMVVRFHSDDTVNRKGFQIMIRQKTDCSQLARTRILPYDVVGQSYCDEEINSQEFYLQSANYPSYYSNFMDCAYIIRKFSSSVCELQLTFLYFDLQDSANCNFDYLEIDGQKYCGTAHQGSVKRITFDKPEVIIRFHSDGSSTGRGYHIFAQQRRDCEPAYRIIPNYPTEVAVAVPAPSLPQPLPPPPPPSCDAQFSSSEFRLRSINYPSNYDNNLNCRLRIQKAFNNVCELELIFNTFDVEDDAGCRYDYLEIGGQRLCGFVRQGTIKKIPFVGQEMLLTFRSDHSNNRPGFDITLIQKSDCVVALPVPPTVPPLIVLPAAPKPQIQLHPVVIQTVTTPVISQVPLSYRLTSVVPSTGCDQVFTTWEFFFQSVNFPLNYGNNVDCTYRAQRFSLSVCEIELHFMSFDTEGHPDCAKDYLEVEGERFCGTITPGTIRRYKFDGPEFVIRFHSDHETSGVGYNVLVRQKTSCPAASPARVVSTVPLSRTVYVPTKTQQIIASKPVHIVPKTTVVPVNDFYFSQPSSQFISLNYPKDYGQNINCTYRIARAKDVCAVEVYFNDFDVYSTPGCSGDYLLFGGKQYCGNELKGQTRMLYFQDSSEAVMDFVTDGIGSGRGWWCFYRQVPCTEVSSVQYSAAPGLCESSFNAELGFIKSVNYPLSLYSSNEDCYFRIQRFRSDVCTVELTFTDFSLEPSIDCTNDYLEIDRKRYCGVDLQKKTLYLNFPIGSNDILLHFKTNNDIEDRGFFIQVRQLSYGCSQPTSLPAVPLQYRLVYNEGCNLLITTEVARFQTPSHPSAYPPNSDCTYTIVRSNPSVCGLEMNFATFALEHSRHCLYDYLQSPTGDRMCGNAWTGVKRTVPFSATEDRLTFVFHSDSRIQDTGFDIAIHQITTGCP